jgi:DNA polymerase elongation subunit (family B)
MDGKKFQIVDLDDKSLTISDELDETELDMNLLKSVSWSQAKDDISPRELFQLYKGDKYDIAKIAKYCIQDTLLCNYLIEKLQVMNNNIGMANVCFVPLTFIFMRGQGIKIFSLVAKHCSLKNYVIPYNEMIESDNPDDSKFDGAYVFDPVVGVHNDPVFVCDFNSLYPNSIREMNLSHEMLVLDEQFMNLPDFKYNQIEYNESGSLKTSIFAEHKNGRTKGILPMIEAELLSERNSVKKMMEKESDAMQKKVLDGRQLALKITANSLYGQCGARTSPIFKKEIAACTTATGRLRLKKAQEFMETSFYNVLKSIENRDKCIEHLKVIKDCSQEDKIIVELKKYSSEEEWLDKKYQELKDIVGDRNITLQVIYGDTDSIFVKLVITDKLTGRHIVGEEAVTMAIHIGVYSSNLHYLVLPFPQNMAYEKTLYPFCILTKKKYVGMLYEENPKKCYQKHMGLVLKRRDNSNIVKVVVGAIVKMIMAQEQNDHIIEFTRQTLERIVSGGYPIDKFVTTKKLKEISSYKDPTRLAHVVLAQRMGERDPGNKPMPNDRIPYVYIVTKQKKDMLQGDKIEHPQFILQNKLKVDYMFYITNQIMNPCMQFLELLDPNSEKIFTEIINRETVKRNKMQQITSFFKPVSK